MTSQIYREELIELWRNPINFGELENPSCECEKRNPLCGDEIKVFLQIEDNKIKNISFKGEGCAISVASASLISEFLKGKSIEEAKKINFETVKNVLGIDVSPARVKCATLFLETVKEALENA